jgi:hypothetical protein
MMETMHLFSLQAARRLQEHLAAIEENLACYQVSRDEQDDDDSCLGDQEPVVAELESYVELHENEDEEMNLQVGLVVSSINDDKIWQGRTTNQPCRIESARVFILAYPNGGSRTI